MEEFPTTKYIEENLKGMMEDKQETGLSINGENW